MDLQKVYQKVDAILDTLDFGALFEGFHKYRFAIYNSREICLDGRVIPYEDGFRGNTSKLHDGEYIAIWNLEFSPVEDRETLAYLLVHEMFHCHQQSNGESRFPSDLALLNYPDDLDNFTKKYNENLYLADACEKRDIRQFERFAALRAQRFAAYPEMVTQEYKAETIEGMAEYIGLKALKAINEEKYASCVRRYLSELRAESSLLFDVRKISYDTGTVFFLCLDAFGRKIENDFGSGLTAYEQNPVNTDGVEAEVRPYDFIDRKYAALLEEKERKIAAHMARSRYVDCNAFICGYDPMNMFRVRNMVYCNYFVALNEDGQTRTIDNAVLLVLAEGSDRQICGYYIE